MSYISAASLAHEVILKRLKRLGDLVPPGALEARSGIRGLSLATLDSFELSVSPVRPTVRTISRLGGRRQLAALLEPQTRRRALGPRRVVGTTGLGGVVIRGLGSVGSVGSKGRRASAARLGRSPAHAQGVGLGRPTARRWWRRRRPAASRVQARTGAGSSRADGIFLVGISLRRLIGAADLLAHLSLPPTTTRVRRDPSPRASRAACPAACPAAALDAHNPFAQVVCRGAPST